MEELTIQFFGDLPKHSHFRKEETLHHYLAKKQPQHKWNLNIINQETGETTGTEEFAVKFAPKVESAEGV
jgi:hypothetical protein